VKSRRILITGLSTYWGGRLAQALEQDPRVETIIGVDSRDPTRELERTEFVRIGTQHALIRRIVQAAEIDTVVDTRLVVDSIWTAPRDAHENNVIGTMNIVTACGGPDSPVRKFVFKSSGHYYGAEQDDPAFFTEGMERPHPPGTPIERDIVEAEATVGDFAQRNPDVTVSVLRFANALGAGMETSHVRLFSLPLVPTILGFDPRYQFIHEDDIVGILEHAVRADIPGIYNGAADGVLVLSEVLDLLGKPMAPVLPPWGTGLVAGPLRRLGLRIPSEMLNQLRYGRGMDNRKLKAAGYDYRYTTRESVIKQREHMRLAPVVRGARTPYRYEQEVEEFLRWSPSVRRSGASAGKAWRPSARQVAELQKALAALGEQSAGEEGAAPRNVPAGGPPGSSPTASRAPVAEYDALASEEVIGLLPSLRRADLEALRHHEAEQRRRGDVLAAIDRLLATTQPADSVRAGPPPP
jgi:UDP-glucose 4-epimerase